MADKVWTWVFVARLGISAAVSAIPSGGIAWWVSDYVVKANTTGIVQAIEASQKSNDTLAAIATNLDANIREATRSIQELLTQQSSIVAENAVQSNDIGHIKGDVKTIKSAVTKAGIQLTKLQIESSNKPLAFLMDYATLGDSNEGPFPHLNWKFGDGLVFEPVKEERIEELKIQGMWPFTQFGDYEKMKEGDGVIPKEQK